MYDKQIPPPHFWLKVVCKKGGVFSGAYSTSCIQRRLYFPFNAQQNTMNIIIMGVGISKDSDK